jgi:hypothetical protein
MKKSKKAKPAILNLRSKWKIKPVSRIKHSAKLYSRKKKRVASLDKE